MSDEFLLGREMVLNRDEKVYAYRLHFRSLSSGSVVPGVFPPADLILDLLSGSGTEEFQGERKGILTISSDLLLSEALAALPADRIILLLDRELLLNDTVRERCHCLREAGFTLALDGGQFSPEIIELQGLIDIIGVDPTRIPADPGMVVEQFHQRQLLLLAERVSTRDEFAGLQGAGFDLFQGLFFTAPTLTAKKKLNETAAILLRIALLIINDGEVEAIVRTVQESPALTYKLLLQANSVVVGVRREIDSVRHAILLLGRDLVRRWAQTELLASSGSHERDNPLVELATARAGLMEQLCRSHPLVQGSRDFADRAFLVGTLSMLESIYNVPLEDLVASVELSADVRVALLRRSGLLGNLLTFVEALDLLNFKVGWEMLPKIDLSPRQVLEAQRRAWRCRAGGTGVSVI